MTLCEQWQTEQRTALCDAIYKLTKIMSYILDNIFSFTAKTTTSLCSASIAYFFSVKGRSRVNKTLYSMIASGICDVIHCEKEVEWHWWCKGMWPNLLLAAYCKCLFICLHILPLHETVLCKLSHDELCWSLNIGQEANSVVLIWDFLPTCWVAGSLQRASYLAVAILYRCRLCSRISSCTHFTV